MTVTTPTYADILKMVETNPQGLFVAIIYTKKGTHEWLPVDKKIFIHQLRLISHPEQNTYPCYFEVERDGEMFIHPQGESKLSIHDDFKAEA
jgi:hypothetical protein